MLNFFYRSIGAIDKEFSLRYLIENYSSDKGYLGELKTRYLAKVINKIED
jgi:hypothetical protein